jgi:hypothetical protein
MQLIDINKSSHWGLPVVQDWFSRAKLMMSDFNHTTLSCKACRVDIGRFHFIVEASLSFLGRPTINGRQVDREDLLDYRQVSDV